MKKHIKFYKGVPLVIQVDGRKVGHSLTRKARRKLVQVQIGMLQFNSEHKAKHFVKLLDK